MNIKLIGKGINFIAKLSPNYAQKISFRLFTSPAPRKQKPAEVEFLAQANKQTVNVLGNKVQVYIWGEGPKILFSHGWESNAGRWRSFVPILVDQGFQVIAFDAPAHGSSEGKRLHLKIYMKTIQALIEKYGDFHTMIGHSMGAGSTVLTLAEYGLGHPKKLILMGCFSEVKGIYKSYEEMLGLTPKLEKLFNKTIKDLTGNEVSHYSIADKIRSLSNVQGLVIHDLQDKTIDVQEARNIAANWAKSRYIETEGAGHSLQTEEIFQIVKNFVIEPIV